MPRTPPSPARSARLVSVSQVWDSNLDTTSIGIGRGRPGAWGQVGLTAPPRPREAGLTPAAVVRPARALTRTLPGDHVPFTCTCAVFVGFAAGVLGVVLLFVLGELGHVGCGPSSQPADRPESVLTGLEGSGVWNRV